MITPRPFTLSGFCLSLCLALWGCGSPQATSPSQDPPQDASKGGAEADPTGSASCESDQDCTGQWTPQMNGCGPTARCMEGACVEPPAMTGVANGETGRMIFETSAGEQQFKVEVVTESFETQRGLMCRDKMLEDWGMVFLMTRTRVQSFWMKNTLIPLDMVFLDENWKVVGVLSDVPPLTLQGRSVGLPSRYVLELSAGAAADAGIVAGAQARFYPPGS